jgi:two-component system sensor histidine kinase PilS (NtrC family)
LSQLAALADRIAAGEREQRLDLPRADEIGALAHSLNSMMERLRDYEARLSSRSRLSALGEMSARLAHEIRNPLTGLKLHLQLLAERVDHHESERVAQLLAEVQRLELLVSSTLMLGREQTAEREQTRLAGLIQEVSDLMGPSLSHRGIETTRRCEESLYASVDRARLRQAILNLVMNAADAMPQGGRLLIAATGDAAAGVLIAVEDSGPGVPDAVRSGLPQAPSSTKPFGLGLGLAVCREVAAAHGGELRIERSAELGGARCVITLPLPAPLSVAAGDT